MSEIEDSFIILLIVQYQVIIVFLFQFRNKFINVIKTFLIFSHM